MPYDLPLSGGHTPRSDKGNKKLNELTELCTKLSDKVTSLEDDLKQTKKIYGKALTKLVKKQLTPTKVTQGEEQCQESSKAQLSVLSAAKILADVSRERVNTYTRRRSTDTSRDSTAGGIFSTSKEVQGKEHISTDKKEMARAVAREKQERIDFEKALELQKYSSRKNMDDLLKNMAWIKMGYFKGMSYDEIRPIFEEEYNKIQTLFKKDTEVEKTKTKRIAEETLL
ncbi:hypothetical protein Tco_0543366 [Tanacetum coccineum]